MGQPIFALFVLNDRVVAPVLIQQPYLARWDGKLPQYTFGGNAAPFVQLPGPSGR